MAIRNIVKDGDPILNKVCRPVTTFDDRLATLLDDMHETMIAADGVGLAGPQVGFAPKELQTGNGIWRVDMMECPYHDTCTEYGCPELCRCFCDSDDISYAGLHPKLIWERSMTLGRGNDRCDFCMKVR